MLYWEVNLNQDYPNAYITTGRIDVPIGWLQHKTGMWEYWAELPNDFSLMTMSNDPAYAYALLVMWCRMSVKAMYKGRGEYDS